MMIGMKNVKTSLVSAALLLAMAGGATGFQQPQPFGLVAGKQNSIECNPAPLIAPKSLDRSSETILSAASTASEGEDRVLDTEAIAKYAGAVVLQMSLITGLFTGIDALLGATGVQIPFAANFFMFYVLALKSRIFNPMSNQRPQKQTKEIKDAVQRKMPEWTPPGVVFPIVWILIIGPLRAASSAILVTGGLASYASPAILALMLHLSIGDTWNTINNVERRYGTSMIGVACVWISAAFAAAQYSQVDPLAGKLLSIPLIWLTIASSLIVRTWQLNPSEVTGEKDSILPMKPASQDGSITKLVWFEKTAE